MVENKSRNFDEELSDPSNWSEADEVALIHCTLDHEPVGIDKHFQMSIIYSRFREMTNKNVSSDTLWRKLGTWYNLEELDNRESDIMPFNMDEEDFRLPAEVIPESYRKFLSEEEKQNIDFSGQFEKCLKLQKGDDQEYSSGLGGSEKMEWFECPQYNAEAVVKEPTEMETQEIDITSESQPSTSRAPQMLEPRPSTDRASELPEELDDCDYDSEEKDYSFWRQLEIARNPIPGSSKGSW